MAAGTVGLISDTHGLLRQAAVDALQGSDLIIHAGDIGDARILERLKTIAPVIAVRGNIDKGEWASTLPATAIAETDTTTIYILHNIQELDLDPADARFGVVVSGHSHKPSVTERAGVLCINPGSAGPRRFRLPITLARLNLDGLKIDFIDLEGSAAGRAKLPSRGGSKRGA